MSKVTEVEAPIEYVARQHIVLPGQVFGQWAAGKVGVGSDLDVGVLLSEKGSVAWFGGNVQPAAVVLAAVTLYGEAAQKVASIAKMALTAPIGVAAFPLVLDLVMAAERRLDERSSARIIWDRFLGFVLGSVPASVGVFTRHQVGELKSLST